MAYDKSEKSRIIVAFGDITRFTAFYDSITNDEKELDPFMQDFIELIESAERSTGYEFTIPGDGFMCTVDLLPGHNCSKTIEVLTSLWDLLCDMNELIRKKEPPRPDGFRVRVACGYVNKRLKTDGETLLWGKHLNLAHNMLEIFKDVPFVCHDSVKQLISDIQIKAHNFKFSKLPTPSIVPDGITQNEAMSMWSFEIRGRKKNDDAITG